MAWIAGQTLSLGQLENGVDREIECKLRAVRKGWIAGQTVSEGQLGKPWLAGQAVGKMQLE
jgi:hypothetical protein